MHRLLARQLAKARKSDGSVDFDRLTELVNEAYEATDRDRRPSVALKADRSPVV